MLLYFIPRRMIAIKLTAAAVAVAVKQTKQKKQNDRKNRKKQNKKETKTTKTQKNKNETRTEQSTHYHHDRYISFLTPHHYSVFRTSCVPLKTQLGRKAVIIRFRIQPAG